MTNPESVAGERIEFKSFATDLPLKRLEAVRGAYMGSGAKYEIYDQVQNVLGRVYGRRFRPATKAVGLETVHHLLRIPDEPDARYLETDLTLDSQSVGVFDARFVARGVHKGRAVLYGDIYEVEPLPDAMSLAVDDYLDQRKLTDAGQKVRRRKPRIAPITILGVSIDCVDYHTKAVLREGKDESVVATTATTKKYVFDTMEAMIIETLAGSEIDLDQ